MQKAKSGYKFVKWYFGKDIEIPDDWEVCKSIKSIKLIHGHQFGENDFVDDDNGIKVVKIGQISTDGKLLINNCDVIDSDRLNEFKEYLINENDILMSLTGNIGRSVRVPKLSEKLLQNYRVGKFVPISNLDETFLLYLLRSSYLFKQFEFLSNKQAQANLGKEEFEKINFMAPKSIIEQQKIASILSNVDELISSYDDTIQATKKLKTGLMQQLLTKGIGHKKFKRVKGYFGKEIEIPENWSIKSLNEIAILVMGQSPSGESYNEFEGTPLLNGPTEFGRIHPTPVQFTDKPTKICQPDDILLCVRGSTTGRLNIADQQYCIGRGLGAIRGQNGISNTKWLYNHFQNIKSLIYNIASGGGSTFPNINQVLIKKIMLPYPDIFEQQKIASILSSVDDKITELESKKKSLESLKKGLMQKLLTGQIRVSVTN